MPSPQAAPALRSLLFVPGNKRNMLEKALGFRPDVFVPDMEDSVPDDEKANARETIRSMLGEYAKCGALVMPRVNGLDTQWVEDDLAAVVGPQVDGICIGKVQSPNDIERLTRMIDGLEAAAGVETGRTRLIPWIETASAVVHCHKICSASPRLVGVAFGAEDFTHDMGIERLDDETQLAYPRAVLCVAARAAGLLALDTPYFRFRDEAGLRENARAARHAGFKGKFAIHPAQIDAINASFSPSAEEIEQARRIVEAFEAAEREGRGSTSLDGKVIDVPVVKRARAVLDLAKRVR